METLSVQRPLGFASQYLTLRSCKQGPCGALWGRGVPGRPHWGARREAAFVLGPRARGFGEPRRPGRPSGRSSLRHTFLVSRCRPAPRTRPVPLASPRARAVTTASRGGWGSSTSPGEAGRGSHTPWVSSFRHEVSRRTQLCGEGRAPGGPSVFARPRGGRARRLRRGTRDGERDPGGAGPGAVSARGSRGSGSGAAAAARGQGFGRCQGRAGLKHQIVAERKEMRGKKVDACPKSKGALNSPGVVREAN